MATVPQRQLLETLLSERILIMDGAMGTMIQRHRLGVGRGLRITYTMYKGIMTC
jgi:methionine synthase I (cobalamin-dependent)